MRPPPAPLQRAPRPARPKGSRPFLATSQGTAPPFGYGAGSRCQRSAPAGSQPHCSIPSRAPPPSHPCCCSLCPAVPPGQAQPAAPSASPASAACAPPQALCPGRSRRAPPGSREQRSVRQRPGCSASGPVQFYCTGANRTEVGTIGGFLALPAPQREPWVSFFCWFVFSLCCVSPQPGQAFPPLEPRCQPFPRGPGSTFFKPRVFLPLGVYSGCSF